jgi:hypothetical protein
MSKKPAQGPKRLDPRKPAPTPPIRERKIKNPLKKIYGF